MRMIRVLVVLGLVAGAFQLAAGPAGASAHRHRAHVTSGPEGCVVSNPANPQYPNPCTYTATGPGGIVGAGTWQVTIVRGTKTITYTDAQGPNQGLGTIQPGDKVTAQATSAGSFVAVGDPCPQSVPGYC